jgi:hypothetical protein
MDLSTVAAIREQMERAQAAAFSRTSSAIFRREAFALGGRLVEREKGRYEIPRAPSILKDRDRLIGRGDPVLDRYARVTFDKTLHHRQPQAELVAPGHPLLDATVDGVGTLPTAFATGRRAGRRQRRGAPRRICWSISNTRSATAHGSIG